MSQRAGLLPPTSPYVMARSGRGRSLCFAAASVLLGGSAAQAGDLDAERLRGLAEAEKSAGRVASLHLVEAYHAIGITTGHPHVGAAREWGESRASRQFMWEQKWRLIVYALRHDRPAHSCRIPTTMDRSNGEEG